MPSKFTTIAHRNCKALCRIVSLGLKYSGLELLQLEGFSAHFDLKGTVPRKSVQVFDLGW
jgi:hypothetical protein